jgi:hypothetical protein
MICAQFMSVCCCFGCTRNRQAPGTDGSLAVDILHAMHGGFV